MHAFHLLGLSHRHPDVPNLRPQKSQFRTYFRLTMEPRMSLGQSAKMRPPIWSGMVIVTLKLVRGFGQDTVRTWWKIPQKFEVPLTIFNQMLHPFRWNVTDCVVQIFNGLQIWDVRSVCLLDLRRSLENVHIKDSAQVGEYRGAVEPSSIYLESALSLLNPSLSFSSDLLTSSLTLDHPMTF